MSTSILIRAHNYGGVLPEAIESAVSQSVKPAEIIIVDDASTDCTPDVVRAALKRTRLLRAVRNDVAVGPAQALNQAVSISSGRNLLPLDADDRLSPRFIELTEAALSQGADIAHAGIRWFGAKEFWVDALPVTHEQMRIENCLPISCSMKRWVFEDVGGFSKDLDYLAYEDWDFWLGAFERGAQFVPVTGCWLDYRQHVSGSRNSMTRSVALKAHLRIYRSHPSVRLTDVGRWMARSVDRNLRGRRK